jgi:hypothetical protein
MTRQCQALDCSDEIGFYFVPKDRDHPERCEAPARFKITRIGGGYEIWLCADCYDVYCAWIGHEPCA